MIDVSAGRHSPTWTTWTREADISHWMNKLPRWSWDRKITDPHEYLMSMVLEALFRDLREQLISVPIGRHEIEGVFEVRIDENGSDRRMAVYIALKEKEAKK